jgi:tetratricopeptide (TPR) repeat protein
MNYCLVNITTFTSGSGAVVDKTVTELQLKVSSCEHIIEGNQLFLDSLKILSKNIKKIKNVYKRSSDNISSIYNIGVLYQAVNKFKKMRKYYDMIIDLDDGMAANNIGYHLYYQYDNKKLAKKYYKIAVSRGCSMAMYNIATYYKYKYMRNKAIEYLTMGSLIDCAKCIHRLYLETKKISYLECLERLNYMDYYYLVGNHHFNQVQFYTGEKMWIQGVEVGNVKCVHALVNWYRNRGDFDSVIKYYKIGIELGDDESLINLGKYYLSVNDTMSFIDYMQHGVCKNISICAFLLGLHYQKISDMLMAIKYFEIGCDLGNIQCVHKLAELHKNNTEKVIDYYKIGCKLYDPYCYGQLVNIYIGNKVLHNKYQIKGIINIKGSNWTTNLVFSDYQITKCIQFLPLQTLERIIKYIQAKEDMFRYILMICDLYGYNSLRDFKKFVRVDNHNEFYLIRKYERLFDKNMLNKLNMLDGLIEIDQMCNICYVGATSIALKCHVSHLVCKYCAWQIERCPYCRNQI